MHWKFKAAIQNVISLLPDPLSYAAYYRLQRHFGRLRRFNPMVRLKAGAEIWKRIKKSGYEPTGKTFFEIGTGRAPVTPLAYWLMGAKGTISIDLNPYLKRDLIKESLQHLSDNHEEILKLFGSLLREDRLNELLHFSKNTSFLTGDFLDLCGIDYIAPCDAANVPLPDQSVDFYTSYTVLEHIPPEVLKEIIHEGNRILKQDGLFIHRIDYSDHFSHTDSSISRIHFLQFSDEEWERYAGNRYMYMNRLRHDDYLQLFESAGHRFLMVDANVDPECRKLLKSGNLQPDKRFRSKPEEVLSITGAWLVTQKQ